MRISIFAVGAAALALAGCNQTPPYRRAGLWQETFFRDGRPPALGMYQSAKICLDNTVEAKSPIFNYDAAVKAARLGNCETPSASHGLDGLYHFASRCPRLDGGSTQAKGTASGDFTTGYHLRLETITVGSRSLEKNGRHVTDIDGRWLGPCPAGLSAGDMIAPNGLKLPGGRFVDPHGGPHSASQRPGAPPAPRPAPPA
jgi:hypothetical protein